jgi:hypothetical protein
MKDSSSCNKCMAAVGPQMESELDTRRNMAKERLQQGATMIQDGKNHGQQHQGLCIALVDVHVENEYSAISAFCALPTRQLLSTLAENRMGSKPANASPSMQAKVRKLAAHLLQLHTSYTPVPPLGSTVCQRKCKHQVLTPTRAA